jgi:hypothetical protein
MADAEVVNELDTELREMRRHFLVPPSEEQIFAEFDVASLRLRPEYQTVANAFHHSLSSALSTVAIPFELAAAGVEQSHFQRIHIAARIRARAYDWDDARTHTEAHSGMHEFVHSEEGRNALIKGTCEFLLASLKRGLEAAAHELLQQGLVLVWSAFEVLCRDVFETLLNGDPEKVRVLTRDPTTRRRFEAERLPLGTLIQHGFNLSARLGTVLVGQQDFSDLPTIKAVYGALYPGSSELSEALASRDLWTLYQRRHLVVHRGGVVDKAYLNASGETYTIGTRLIVTPLDFERAVSVVVSAGTALAHSLST